jgi:hypothetical protein
VNKAVPYHRFNDFIAVDGNRFDVLTSLLDELKLAYRVVTIAGKRHIFISSASSLFDQEAKKKPVVLVAHYDCVPGSPGANDNGAAVFMLAETARRLRGKPANDWLLIFTDKEELEQGESLKNQGSYLLAKGFRETGLGAGRFFIFDACGRGDTLIISTTADYLLKNEHGKGSAALKNQLRLLRMTALKAAENSGQTRFLLLPTPFSDDAGFLRSGLAAQTITVLPAKEAAEFASVARYNDLYINALISSGRKERHEKNRFPETWRLLNSPHDKESTLNEGNFENIIQFALELCCH